jgi:hypothetical protein
MASSELDWRMSFSVKAGLLWWPIPSFHHGKSNKYQYPMVNLFEESTRNP